ncbi:MAG: hypothetical protein HC935_03970 [Pseudanabaena sp. SU_2_4]|nr:hypothetical protein [Pseudanabaena sp. SU_2_4]
MTILTLHSYVSCRNSRDRAITTLGKRSRAVSNYANLKLGMIWQRRKPKYRDRITIVQLGQLLT